MLTTTHYNDYMTFIAFIHLPHKISVKKLISVIKSWLHKLQMSDMSHGGNLVHPAWFVVLVLYIVQNNVLTELCFKLDWQQFSILQSLTSILDL